MSQVSDVAYMTIALVDLTICIFIKVHISYRNESLFFYLKHRCKKNFRLVFIFFQDKISTKVFMLSTNHLCKSLNRVVYENFFTKSITDISSICWYLSRKYKNIVWCMNYNSTIFRFYGIKIRIMNQKICSCIRQF